MRYARLAELADALDLGSSGRPWGFKSLVAHQKTLENKAFQGFYDVVYPQPGPVLRLIFAVRLNLNCSGILLQPCLLFVIEIRRNHFEYFCVIVIQ